MDARKEQRGDPAPNTPTVNESHLAAFTVDELKGKAKYLDIDGFADMRRPELVDAMVDALAGRESSAGDDDGGVHTGPASSKSLEYSQEISSPDDEHGSESNFSRLENPNREDA
jgi:hypothetical protein